MSPEDARLLRRTVALSEPRAAVLRLTGEGAVSALDRVLPCEVWLRDGQIKSTVLLDEDGTLAADVLLACDGDEWLVLADGVEANALAALLLSAADGSDLDVVDLGATCAQVALDGPFAWAVLSEWDEPGAAGLPYLSLYQRDDVRVLRAGRTGEFGYTLIVPRERAEALASELLALGAPCGIRRVPMSAIGYCALENGFLDMDALRGERLDPRALQLRWRLDPGKRCRGSDALRARPLTERTTAFRSRAPLARGAPVDCEGQTIGRVLVAAEDAGGEGWLGLLLLDRAFAAAGIEGFAVEGVPIRTVSVPMIRNRSLYVRPQRHTLADEPTLPYPYPA